MKYRVFTVAALIVFTLSLTSCYSSRKSRYGCPMNNVKANTSAGTVKQA